MKKKLLILFTLFFTVSAVFAQWDWPSERVIKNGDLSALNNVFLWSELGFLSQSDLRILRNTIFARYGRIFTSQDLTRHFRQFAWYNPIHSNVDRFLTATDKENIHRIQELETHGSIFRAYQNRVLSWIQSERIQASSSTITFNEIRLFSNPTRHPRAPENIMEHPMTVLSCSAMGRFLSPAESNMIKLAIEINGLSEKTDFDSFIYEHIKDAVIFNPSVLFGNSESIGREYAYLIFLSRDTVMQITQDNRIREGFADNLLYSGGSVMFFVLRVTSDGGVEFVTAHVAG